MLSTSDFKKGLKLLIDNQPYSIVDFQHVKPGKGNQFTRTRLKNMITGHNLEKTFKSGEKFESPDVVIRNCRFLYSDESGFHFMDTESYDQHSLNEDDLGQTRFYLIESLEVTMMFFNNRAIGIDCPNTVKLRVVRTDPGHRGNTVTGGSKPATLETGLVVSVPLHINEGDTLKVDTRTGEYMERSNS